MTLIDQHRLEVLCRRRLAFPLPLPSMFKVLLSLLPVALATPLSFPWGGQEPVVHSWALQAPKAESGWTDPRILGGQFIDVGLQLTSAEPLTTTIHSLRRRDTVNP